MRLSSEDYESQRRRPRFPPMAPTKVKAPGSRRRGLANTPHLRTAPRKQRGANPSPASGCCVSLSRIPRARAQPRVKQVVGRASYSRISAVKSARARPLSQARALHVSAIALFGLMDCGRNSSGDGHAGWIEAASALGAGRSSAAAVSGTSEGYRRPPLFQLMPMRPARGMGVGGLLRIGALGLRAETWRPISRHPQICSGHQATTLASLRSRKIFRWWDGVGNGAKSRHREAPKP